MEGGCYCGQVRYRLLEKPMFVHCCHCRDCQSQTGSAFAINALIETDNVALLSGDLIADDMPTSSGRPHDVYRCSTCHTAIWSDYGRRTVLLFVRVGTLDDRADIEPDVHIFARSKLPWVKLPKKARVFDVYYDMEAEWPKSSLKRRKALKV